jgi:hypothetical protein
MDSLKKLKSFPDKWYRKLTTKEIEKGRRQLTAYSVSKELDLSLREVFIL